MKRLLPLLVLVPLLAACNEPEDHTYKYKGYPIDCVQAGAGNSRVLSCDFVQWHMDYDRTYQRMIQENTP